MQHYFFESLDSTSTKAQELLARLGERRQVQSHPGHDANVPFAVQAFQQTQGRGRRGHAWQSPRGNLYLTLVLPPPLEAHCDLCVSHGVGLTPLKAAVILGQLIDDAVGISVTLKWPNDLYLYGAKLAGLLVESSVTRVDDEIKWSPLLIGIGLNLNTIPEGMESAATSIAHYTGTTQDPKAWGLRIGEGFAAEWAKVTPCQVAVLASRRSLAPGHPWLDLGSGELCYQEQILPTGGLSLRPVVKGLAQKPSRPALVELNSAHHNMTWAYTFTGFDSRSGASAARTSPLIVADVGNSRIKFAAFKDSLRDGGPQWVTSMPSLSVGSPTQSELHTFMADLTTCLSRVDQPQPQSQPLSQLQLGWPIHILSVNPQAAQVLTENLSPLGFRPLMVQKRTSLLHPNGFKPYDFNQLGIDRMAAMEGFLAGLTAEERRSQSLGIVISAGTATTIDFVSTAGEHWGGVILPGLEFSLRMLHQETGLLPLTTPVAGAIDLGSDTLGALRQGVIAMTVGAVNTLRHEVRLKSHAQRKECVQDEILVVTGGLGDLLTEHLGASRYEKDLVLCGTRSMVLSGA